MTELEEFRKQKDVFLATDIATAWHSGCECQSYDEDVWCGAAGDLKKMNASSTRKQIIRSRSR